MTRRPPPREPPQADLFEAKPAARPKDTSPVELALQLVDQTDAGWLLRPAIRGAPAKWAPKSEVRRLEGERAGVFRMARWLAADRGWL